MRDEQLEILRQIRRRLTVIAAATSIVAVVVVLPYALALFAVLTQSSRHGGAML